MSHPPLLRQGSSQGIIPPGVRFRHAIYKVIAQNASKAAMSSDPKKRSLALASLFESAMNLEMWESNYRICAAKFVNDIKILASYVPSTLRHCLASLELDTHDASFVTLPAVAVFADVSGYSKLAEMLDSTATSSASIYASSMNLFSTSSKSSSAIGGAENVRNLLNQYFCLLLDAIEKAGGDVVKVAGDGVVAIWRADGPGGYGSTAATAITAMVDIAKKFNEYEVTYPRSKTSCKLSLHAGVGVGPVQFSSVGGTLNQWFIVATGDSITQSAKGAELCGGGQVVVSKETWEVLARNYPVSYFQIEHVQDGYFLLNSVDIKSRPVSPGTSSPFSPSPAPRLQTPHRIAVSNLNPFLTEAFLKKNPSSPSKAKMHKSGSSPLSRRTSVSQSSSQTPRASMDGKALEAALWSIKKASSFDTKVFGVKDSSDNTSKSDLSLPPSRRSSTSNSRPHSRLSDSPPSPMASAHAERLIAQTFDAALILPTSLAQPSVLARSSSLNTDAAFATESNLVSKKILSLGEDDWMKTSSVQIPTEPPASQHHSRLFRNDSAVSLISPHSSAEHSNIVSRQLDLAPAPAFPPPNPPTRLSDPSSAPAGARRRIIMKPMPLKIEGSVIQKEQEKPNGNPMKNHEVAENAVEKKADETVEKILVGKEPIIPSEPLHLRRRGSKESLLQLSVGVKLNSVTFAKKKETSPPHSAPSPIPKSRLSEESLREMSMSPLSRIVSPGDGGPLAGLIIPNMSTFEKKMREYVNPAVLNHLRAFSNPEPAHIRIASMLFLKLDTAFPSEEVPLLDQMHYVVGIMQSVVHLYGGNIKEFGVDDKGTVLVVGFGVPPVSHTDDANRACLAALELKNKLAIAGFGVSIGVTTGSVFCGSIGSSNRREYAMVGAVVNLAARLMMSCKALGVDILCDETTKDGCKHIDFTNFDPIFVKGRAERVAVYSPSYSASARNRKEKQPAVGVDIELFMVKRSLENALDSRRGYLLLVEGTVGAGKTKMLYEFWSMCDELDLNLVWGKLPKQTPAAGVSPLNIWALVCRAVLDLDEDADQSECMLRVASVLEEWQEWDSSLSAREGLLVLMNILGFNLHLRAGEDGFNFDENHALRCSKWIGKLLMNGMDRVTTAVNLDNAQCMPPFAWAIAFNLVEIGCVVAIAVLPIFPAADLIGEIYEKLRSTSLVITNNKASKAGDFQRYTEYTRLKNLNKYSASSPPPNLMSSPGLDVWTRTQKSAPENFAGMSPAGHWLTNKFREESGSEKYTFVLQPLDENSVSQIVSCQLGARAALSDVARFLQERCSGNPRFVGDWLKSLDAASFLLIENGVVKWAEGANYGLYPGPPNSIHAVVGFWRAHLSQPADLCLQACSMLGNEITAQDLLVIFPFDPLTWSNSSDFRKLKYIANYLEELEDADILGITTPSTPPSASNPHSLRQFTRTYRFRWMLLQHIVYLTIPGDQKIEYHRNLAAKLQENLNFINSTATRIEEDSPAIVTPTTDGGKLAVPTAPVRYPNRGLGPMSIEIGESRRTATSVFPEAIIITANLIHHLFLSDASDEAMSVYDSVQKGLLEKYLAFRTAEAFNVDENQDRNWLWIHAPLVPWIRGLHEAALQRPAMRMTNVLRASLSIVRQRKHSISTPTAAGGISLTSPAGESDKLSSFGTPSMPTTPYTPFTPTGKDLLSPSLSLSLTPTASAAPSIPSTPVARSKNLVLDVTKLGEKRDKHPRPRVKELAQIVESPGPSPKVIFTGSQHLEEIQKQIQPTLPTPAPAPRFKLKPLPPPVKPVRKVPDEIMTITNDDAFPSEIMATFGFNGNNVFSSPTAAAIFKDKEVPERRESLEIEEEKVETNIATVEKPKLPFKTRFVQRITGSPIGPGDVSDKPKQRSKTCVLQ